MQFALSVLNGSYLVYEISSSIVVHTSICSHIHAHKHSPLALNAPIAARYGEGSGQIAYTDVECTGNESSIFNCSNSGLFNNTCSHGKDASVVCAGE